MTEYIEREAISEEIRKYYYKNPPNFSYGEGFDRGLDRAQRAILDAPAADVVPVVRCKDCKYWQDNNDGYPHEECRWGHGETPDANDFCSYGTRKDGDAAGGLASVAETRFVYCPKCGARMDGGSYAKAD